MKYRPKEEYIYMDLHLNMSNKAMANILYAGIITEARFTTLWTLDGQSYNRKQNSRNGASIKVHIHPEEILLFNELSEHILQEPQVVKGQ